jgi:hypothetical protein
MSGQQADRLIALLEDLTDRLSSELGKKRR